MQATLSAIDLPNLHKFIQETDVAALSECDEEGVHTPLLLDSLDLALWTSIFVTATSDPDKSVATDLFIEDNREVVCMENLSPKLELALKVANEDALELVSTRGPVPPSNSESGHSNSVHPLLAKLRISPADKTTLEDFSDNIQSSQIEKGNNTLVNTKGYVVPLKLPRCIELLIVEYHHKMWATKNTNMLASITVQMWKTRVGLTDGDIDNFKKQVLSNVDVLRAPIDLLPAFSLNMFEHSKCTNT